MKNFKNSIAIIVFTSLVVTGFAFTPHRIEPVDIRAEGMGGPYLTDSESFYTLFANPAGLAFVGEKTLWPPIVSLSFGGPLEEINDYLVAPEGMSDDAITDMMTSLIGDSGFNINARIGGPLTFGAIKNNFGWGFVNTISVSGQIPSLNKSDINAAFDLGLVFGYAFPLDFGSFGKLSIGFSGRGVYQVAVSFTEGVTTLLEGDLSVETLPLSATFGLGFDMGVQYEVLDLIHVAIVWQDVYTPTWTKIFSGYEAAMNGEEGSSVRGVVESQFGLGLGLDIPLEKITNSISHFGIYLDYSNLLPLFNDKTENVSRNPILELSFGTELVLFDVFALRLGVNEMYPSAGLGIYLRGFRMDFSIYGKELGLEPGYSPQMNVGLAMTIQY